MELRKNNVVLENSLKGKTNENIEILKEVLTTLYNLGLIIIKY